MYSPLDQFRREIRLLNLAAGSTQDPVRGQLTTVPLVGANCPEYETISYCWGDKGLITTVHIDDVALEVPVSAFQALRRLRHVDRDRVLWIDSICINQNDVAERGHQVALMYEVYRLAQTNLVWLGEDEHGIGAQALREVNHIMTQLRQQNGMTASQARVPWTVNHQTVPYTHEAIVHLFSLPWFRRLWIVQEVTLARHNLCYYGQHEVPLSDLLRVASWLHENRSSLRLSPEAFSATYNATVIHDFTDREAGWYSATFPNRTTAKPLLSILQALRYFNAEDPRDHVFGILGLYRYFSADPIPEELNPDYEKSPAHVLARATKCCIDRYQNLNILHSDLSRRRDEIIVDQLPSWVPPCYRDYDATLLSMRLGRHYRADNGRSLARLDYADDDVDTLVLRGLTIDTIEVVGACCDTTEQLRSLLLAIPTLMSRHPAAIKRNWIESDVPRAVTADENITEQRASETDLAAYTVLISLLSKSRNTPLSELFALRDPTDFPDERIQAAQSFEACWQACKGQCFFVTGDGYLGLGPRDTKRGDQAVILYGSRLPFVLRPRSQSDAFQLMGCCYVQGIMYGEAVREHHAKGEQDGVFVLR